MTDLIQVTPGASPWKPTQDATLEAEYQYYDVPTLGVIRQHGADFLFRCFDDSDPVSFWSYTHLTPGEREWLDAANSSDEFEKKVDSLVASQSAVVAMALVEVGILTAEVVAVLTDENAEEVALALAHDLGEKLRRENPEH